MRFIIFKMDGGDRWINAEHIMIIDHANKRVTMIDGSIVQMQDNFESFLNNLREVWGNK